MTMVHTKDSIGVGGGVNGVFFTADTHFGHRKMVEYRGFKDIDEMDKAMIQRWNEKVKPGDIVYHLGDFSFRKKGETLGIIRRLNGAIRLVKGNHDKIVKGEVLRAFDWVKEYYETTGPDKVKIVLCHYAFTVWNKSHYGAWNLHGHSHGSLTTTRDIKQMDVGVDTNDLYPYSMADVERIMAKKGYEAVDHHTKGSR